MSETETTGGPPVVKWMRGTGGTISVARAGVKGEVMVELAIREASGSAQLFLLSESDARTLALRIHSAALVGGGVTGREDPVGAGDIAEGYARWVDGQSPAGSAAE